MINLTQSNNRAVTRFTALFICIILVCGIALPLIVFAYSYNVYYLESTNIQKLCIDGYYTFYYSSGQDIYNSFSSTTYFTDVYCACWDTPSQSYVICEVYSIYATRWTNNSPFGSTTSYGWGASGRYNNNSFTIRSNNSGITLYYQDTQGNTTTHAPKLFYIKQGATCSRGVNNFKLTTGDWYQIGYTLTFNSQGGSSISPLTGVSGIVHLGESGQYYPQYVPTKHGYEFIGWSLTENGTVVWDVDVQADTTLYARWQIQGTYREITFGEGFYEDPECTEDIAGALVLYNTEMVVYAKRDDFTPNEFNQLDKWKHFYGNITLTQTDGTHDSRKMQGHAIRDTQYKWADNVFEFHIVVDKNYHVECNFANTYNYTVKIIYNDYESLKPYVKYYYWQDGLANFIEGVLNPWWETSNEHTYLTDDYLGINDKFYIELPYVMFSANITVPDNLSYVNTDIIINSKVVEDNSEYHASNLVYFTANPYYNHEDLEQNIFPLLTINCKSITDYDITQDYHPLIVYDESTGEASWGFEEVSLLDTNWNTVADNVPYKMNHIWDGIFSLSGLAVLIPLVMMVSFAMWFIRRS